MVTNGSMEAAALLFRYMIEPGDRVIVEQPSYDRTLLLLGRTGAELVPVALEDDGLDVDAFEAALAAGPVKLAHVIPNFHNPAGCTLSAAKRERLVELAGEHGFWIFEDDPYRLIRFGDAELPPTMLSQDRERARNPCLLVLEDGQPRRSGGLPRRAAGADRHAGKARLRALHLAQHAGRVGRARALPLGRPRAQRRVRQRGARRAPGRAGRVSARTDPGGRVRRPRGRLLPVAGPPRGRRHARPCSMPRRSSASRSSPAPTSCSTAARRACGCRSPASPPSGSTRASGGSPPPSPSSAPRARPRGRVRSRERRLSPSALSLLK